MVRTVGDTDTVDIDGMAEQDDCHIAVHNTVIVAVLGQHPENHMRVPVDPDDLPYLHEHFVSGCHRFRIEEIVKLYLDVERYAAAYYDESFAESDDVVELHSVLDREQSVHCMLTVPTEVEVAMSLL